MCMNQPASYPDVGVTPTQAVAGKGIKPEDPRFKANVQRKRRVNRSLTIRRPSSSST